MTKAFNYGDVHTAHSVSFCHGTTATFSCHIRCCLQESLPPKGELQSFKRRMQIELRMLGADLLDSSFAVLQEISVGHLETRERHAILH